MSKKSTDEQAGSSDPVTNETARSGSKPASGLEDQAGRPGIDTGKRSGKEKRAAEPEPGDAEPRQRRGASGLTATFALLIALTAAGFTAWQTYESRREKAELELELARKLEEVCPVDIFSAANGTVEIVRESLNALKEYIEHQGLSGKSVVAKRSDYTPI